MVNLALVGIGFDIGFFNVSYGQNELLVIAVIEFKLEVVKMYWKKSDQSFICYYFLHF